LKRFQKPHAIGGALEIGTVKGKKNLGRAEVKLRTRMDLSRPKSGMTCIAGKRKPRREEYS